MPQWTSDFINDPFNDFELMIEILKDDKDVAVIKQGNNGLELKLYACENDLVIPMDWLLDVMNEANKSLGSKRNAH